MEIFPIDNLTITEQIRLRIVGWILGGKLFHKLCISEELYKIVKIKRGEWSLYVDERKSKSNP